MATVNGCTVNKLKSTTRAARLLEEADCFAERIIGHLILLIIILLIVEEFGPAMQDRNKGYHVLLIRFNRRFLRGQRG